MTYFSLIISFVLLLLSSCQQREQTVAYREWMSNNGKIKVLSTTAMIDDIVKKVGGHHVDTLVLIKGDLDPHSYELVKGDDEKLSYASLVFYNGLELEHGPSLKYSLEHSGKAIAVGEYIRKVSPDEILYVSGQPDPHVWMDISLWMTIIDPIVEALKKKDPQHANEFEENAKLLKMKMASMNEDVYLLLQAIPKEKRYLVTTHDAFSYFARAYLAEEDETADQWEKRVAAPNGLAPESQISVTDIQAIIDHLHRYNIKVIFAESNVSRDSLRKIVSASTEMGMTIKIAEDPLYGDAMASPGTFGDTYLEMISHDAITMARYLMQ